MTDTNYDDDLLPVGVASLSDYTPNKLHILLTLPMPIDIEASQEILPVKTDNSFPVQRRQSAKPKSSSRKSDFIRCLMPIARMRSLSVPSEQDGYHQKPIPIRSVRACDMRLFITRHGERVDRYFGSNWYMLAFNQQNQYRPYHRNLPPQLPARANKYFWALDTPLTVAGLNAAKRLGRALGAKYYIPTYVYSSPAMRCILTTIQILKGLGLEHKIPIRIEPGLLELGAARYGMNIFFQSIDWYKFGVNIDLSYQPIVRHIPPIEHENTYYLRSKHVIREIEKLHNNSKEQSTNILIVAHATSSETLTWDLIGKQPNVNDLYKVSLNVAYLQTVITERRQENKSWSLKAMRWA
ncbi:unnamed protein product [Rotaria socialis]|uniref:Phosphoglycerate mutase n=1 Tax=Rotaria socialis TaxID=392032 RepID=A0A819ZBP5_9BILA|nr:unnamed protein product [Rotaria socialis]CAF3326746.1 unnamed protein product [Rotaria socialis]CAF3398812.1 unnamed protein product [Rotaria socialis]CAF3770596.1 unnamed protein product [Rotaria socialis]CAF3781336.1 unnamed protein product [Rotaria socialis]